MLAREWTPKDRARHRVRCARARRVKVAFYVWLGAERAAGREPSISERIGERERIRRAVR